MQLQDKGVLVTGGASGLGEACVRLLTLAGAKVVIADLNSDAGIALSTEHSHTGLSTLFVKTDVTDEESMRATVKEALETFGSLDVLINCAGIGPDGPRVRAPLPKTSLLKNASNRSFKPNWPAPNGEPAPALGAPSGPNMS